MGTMESLADTRKRLARDKTMNGVDSIHCYTCVNPAFGQVQLCYGAAYRLGRL